MKKTLISISLSFLSLASIAYADAAPTAANLTLTVKEFSSSRVIVNMVHRFDEALARGDRCEVTLSGCLTTIDDDAPNCKRKRISNIVLRKGRRVRLSADLRPVAGPTLYQLNVQSRSICLDRNKARSVIVSNVDATNVTCSSGVSASRFIDTLQGRAEEKRAPLTLASSPKGSGSCRNE